VQYPKGIAPRSQTGMALAADFLDRPMVQCPCGVLHPTDAAPYPLTHCRHGTLNGELNGNGNNFVGRSPPIAFHQAVDTAGRNLRLLFHGPGCNSLLGLRPADLRILVAMPRRRPAGHGCAGRHAGSASAGS
jgi:hypothetical protein